VKAVTVVQGRMVPLDRADVDTDQIMPKQFLKRIERTGFGEFVFDDWRRDPDFVLNDPRHAGATILVAGANFGSGSSREHAPWGLQQYGFEVVVAPSFADIFRSNCAKIGLLCVSLPETEVKALMALAEADPTAVCTVDLPAQRLQAGQIDVGFAFDAHSKHMLVNGLDEIGQTLERDADIADFEASRPAFMPVTSAPAG
jgi:3-isopropylmalate/(R)-2-methylmalate dehydratase small subunit